MKDPLSRRTFFKQMAAAGVLTSAALPGFSSAVASDASQANSLVSSSPDEVRDRLRRMKWWHEAKYGMFIHFGLYSLLGQHEWAMEAEGVPIPQYELLATHFAPKTGCAKEWVKLAQRAGQ
jgi:alpha-L-fucosidase